MADAETTSRAVLEPDTEKQLSVERARYVLLGSNRAVEEFCKAKFGKALDELPNVRSVTRPMDVSVIRSDRSWTQRGTAYRAPVVMLLPGWSRQEGLMSEALLYELAMLDDGRQ